MFENIPALVYIIGLAFAEFLRWRYRWARKSSQSESLAIEINIVWSDRLVLASILIGFWIVRCSTLQQIGWADQITSYHMD